MGRRGVKSRGQKVIDWIEKYCRIPEGKFVGDPVRLRPWQKKEIRRVYDNPAVTRLAILSFARKNAKTTLAAFLLLCHLAGPEHRRNSQLGSTAQSRDQAALLFDLAAKMVRMSPKLDAFIGIRDHKKQLYCPELGTIYKALSADAATNFGGSFVFVVHDELGQVKGPRFPLYEAVETGMGAHDDPLSIVISTQAPTDADLLSVLIDDALGGYDPKVTVSLYTAPMADPPFHIKTLRKANPAYGDFLNAEEVKKSARDAKRMPSREPSYRNLILNQRVDANSPFIPRTVWDQNGGAVRKDWGKAPVYGGLDLSATTDLTSLELIAKFGDNWHIDSTFWLPGENLTDKAQRDRVPYDTWRDQGFLEVTPGSTVEYAWVAHELRAVFDRYNIRKICFDRWNWRFLEPWLVEAGFRDHELEKFEPFGQGYQSMSPALREFESILLSRRMRHGDHPVLGMCAANAVVQTDPAGNRKLAKDKSSGRIDGMVALAQAVAAASGQKTQQYVTGKVIVA